MITYVSGDVTKPIGDGNKLIPHCCNNLGIMGAGVARAIAKRWPNVERAYQNLMAQRPLILGEVQFVSATPTILVANIIGQDGVGPDYEGKPPIRYEAIREGLLTISSRVPVETTIHAPMFGAGLAGGDWSIIEQMLKDILNDYTITIYTF